METDKDKKTQYPQSGIEMNGGGNIGSTTTVSSSTSLDRFRKFGQESTLHGIHYVTNPDVHGVRR